MFARLRQAISSTVPVSPISAMPATPSPASLPGRVLVDIRGSVATVIPWSLLSAESLAICCDSVSRREDAISIVTPGLSRPSTITVPATGSARPPPLFLKMSFTTVSNSPSGSQSSGAATAIVPPNPCGATPTIVKSTALIFIVLPTKPGANPVARHFS